MNAKDWIEIIGGFFAGATASAIVTVRICKKVWCRSATTVQTGNKAGGDIVGGDKIERR